MGRKGIEKVQNGKVLYIIPLFCVRAIIHPCRKQMLVSLIAVIEIIQIRYENRAQGGMLVAAQAIMEC